MDTQLFQGLRAKGLVTSYGEGGATNGGGGPVKFYLYEKGSGIFFRHAEGGALKV